MMTEISRDIFEGLHGVAIVQFPEQIDIFKKHFTSSGIANDAVLWIAITETALVFLEKEDIRIARITDFYDYNKFQHYIFDESYELLEKILKRFDKEVFKRYALLEKYDMSFCQFSFYYLRTWCDSIELRIYEFLHLKKILPEELNIYYVSFDELAFPYGSYPYHTNHSLDLAISFTMNRERIVQIGCYNPQKSIAGYRPELESEVMLRKFRRNAIRDSLIRRSINFLHGKVTRKIIMCIGLSTFWFDTSLKDTDIFVENLIYENGDFKHINELVCNVLQENDFQIMNISFQKYFRFILARTLEEFLKSTHKAIHFYKGNKDKDKWKCILSSGFNTFESKALAKIFQFYKKRVYCIHHGSFGILKDKLCRHMEYPFVTDYFVWGDKVKKQIIKEGDFDDINIYSIGSVQIDYMKRKILHKRKKMFDGANIKPTIIFLVQTVNDGTRVTFDHPPGIVDFNQQRKLIYSLLKIKLDYKLVLKGHPSFEGYHSALRFLFHEDSRVHFVSSLQLSDFLSEGTHFITDRPSTSLLQAMSCGLKSYCLINSDFYVEDFTKSLDEDNVFFPNHESLTTVLHKDLINFSNETAPPYYAEGSAVVEGYCNPFNDSMSYDRILNIMKADRQKLKEITYE